MLVPTNKTLVDKVEMIINFKLCFIIQLNAELIFFSIADQTIQKASRSLEEAKAKGDPNRTLSIMETFLNTEGLSKSDVATMVLDMMMAGVDTVRTEQSALKKKSITVNKINVT